MALGPQEDVLHLRSSTIYANAKEGKMEAQKRRGMQAVLLSAAFFLGVVSLPGVATANGPDFDISVNSGPAGRIIELDSIDPCPSIPTGYDEQYATFTFIDASNEVTVFDSAPNANSSGHWDNGIITIPWAEITQYDPLIYSEEAAIGTGTIQAKCVITKEGEDEYGDPITIRDTSQEYVSQPFEVTGSTPTFITIPTQVEAGESVSIASVNPCFGEISIFIADEDEFESTQELGDPQTGSWTVQLPTHTNNVPFSTGMYSVVANCVPTGQIYGFYYTEAFVEVVPSDHYVAMGDSYSSGTGTFNYTLLYGDCYRSPDSYGFYVADELGIGDPSVTACHGAQTADFYGQNPNTGMSAQLDSLTTSTAYVTLTIGGNDAGFSSVLERCTDHPANQGWGCSTDSSVITTLDQRFDALAGTAGAQAPDGRSIASLEQLYVDIAAEAPNAEIYVGGYPRLFGSSSANYDSNGNAPGGASCAMTIGATVSYSDAQWLNQKADELNGIIANAVAAAQNEGVDVTYVPAALFSGSGLCDTYTPWINEVMLTDPPIIGFLPESLHPTMDGYVYGYGDAFVAVMN
jgi:lysophospholipase L1-like esterase